MEKMTGERKMSTKAIREYFQPLESWLKQENKNNGVTVGWGQAAMDNMCRSHSAKFPGQARATLQFYNENLAGRRSINSPAVSVSGVSLSSLLALSTLATLSVGP